RYMAPSEFRKHILTKNDGTQPLEPPMRVSQVEIEPVLKKAIDARPEVEVRFGVAFESFEEKDDRVVAVLREQGSGAQELVTCQYLIGCDGGSSRVRAGLGNPVGGTGARRRTLHDPLSIDRARSASALGRRLALPIAA